jgi:hypothetical protein
MPNIREVPGERWHRGVYHAAVHRYEGTVNQMMGGGPWRSSGRRSGNEDPRSAPGYEEGLAMTFRLVFRAVVISALLWAQVAHTSPGDLDTSFAGDGVAETDSPGGTYEPRVAVYSDARTVLAASTRATTSNRSVFSVWRFTSTGAPDLTFGSTGNGRFLVDFSGYDAFLTGVAIQPDGKVVLAGVACAPRDPQSPDLPTNCSVAVARLLPTGRYDPAFAFGGRVLVPTGDSWAAVALVIHPLDGGIVIAGGQWSRSRSGGHSRSCA